MSIESGSYVVVKTSVAKDLVTAKLIFITRKRAELRRKFLLEEVERLNKPTFWKKLFRVKPVTEEDVIAREESSEFRFENQLWIIEGMYSDLERLCWAVQSACRLTSSDTINLSLEDAERIQ